MFLVHAFGCYGGVALRHSFCNPYSFNSCPDVFCLVLLCLQRRPSVQELTGHRH